MCVKEGTTLTVIENFQDKRLQLHKDKIVLACSRHHVQRMVLLHNKEKNNPCMNFPIPRILRN